MKTVSIVLSFIALSACAEVDQKDLSSTSKQSNVATSEEEEGVIVGDFKSDASGDQTLVASEKSEIDDVSATLAPGTIAVDTKLSLQNGKDRGATLPSELGLGDVVIAGGSKPIHFDNGAGTNPVKPFTLEIPIPLSDTAGTKETKLLAGGGKVGLLYIYRESDGTYRTGISIVGTDNIFGVFVKMAVGGFGWYRLVFLSAAVESAEAETEEAPEIAD